MVILPPTDFLHDQIVSIFWAIACSYYENKKRRMRKDSYAPYNYVDEQLHAPLLLSVQLALLLPHALQEFVADVQEQQTGSLAYATVVIDRL